MRKRRDMEIVVEYVLLQNFIIDFLILKTTALIIKVKARFVFLNSMFASIIALLLPLFHLTQIAEFVLKIFLAILLVSISFPYHKFSSFLKIYLTFFFSTFIYGGVASFFVQTFGQLHTLVILSIVFLTYLLFVNLWRYLSKRKQIENFCFEVKLKDGERECECVGFLDTGNLLSDPLTNRPVNLVSYTLFQKLFNIDIKDVVSSNIDKKSLKFAHYINLGTVTSGGRVLAFQIDKLTIGDKEVEKPILALCLKNFSNYEMILNQSFAF